jgi:DNA-binding beta-propeller fold protein YncE
MNAMTPRRRFLQIAVGALATPFVSCAPTERPRTVSTLAGTGVEGTLADGVTIDGQAISSPFDMIIGPDGGFYWCEMRTARIFRLDLDTGEVSLVAGDGTTGYGGDGGPAVSAQLAQPHELAFDSTGNLYVVERSNHTVRRIDLESGVITTVAGTGTRGYSGDGGPAAQAEFAEPHGIVFDRDDNLYICDISNHRIRRVDPGTGIVTTFAGTGDPGFPSVDGSIAEVPLPGPRSMDIAPDGMMYAVLRGGNAVFSIDPAEGRVERLAGTGEIGYSGDGGPALDARFGSDDFAPEVAGPKGVTHMGDGRLYVADSENHVIRMIDLETRTISTVVGDGEQGDGPDGDPLGCRLNRPHGIYAHEDRLYIADSDNNRIRVLE